MKYCPKCGKPSDGNYCPNCGTQLKQDYKETDFREFPRESQQEYFGKTRR